MDILNVSGLELFFLLALAIMLLGPQKAIDFARQAAKVMASFRRTMNLLKDDLRTEFAEEERAVRDAQRDLQDSINANATTIREAQVILDDQGESPSVGRSAPQSESRDAGDSLSAADPKAPNEERTG